MSLKILLLSPYHGGSHAAWANGFAAASQYDVRLLTLPDRFWKWRMHGGAVSLARRFLADEFQPELILATDMLDLSTFLALTRQRLANVPALLYMHENQLTYPLPADPTTGAMRRQHGERDRHYVFVNYASMLAATAVFFNSSYHKNAWFTALPNFLKHFPDFNELDTVAELERKAAVLPVGINLSRFAPPSPSKSSDQPPLILWNQRWEYDKNPTQFFAALYAMQKKGIPFRLALCGQQYGKKPAVFAEASDRLAHHIIHQGFADSQQYRRLLWEADIVISTAHHEFFGISMVEAISCQTFPILPERLAYPELISPTQFPICFYQSDEELHERLLWALLTPEARKETAKKAQTAVSRYSWANMSTRYDTLLADSFASAHEMPITSSSSTKGSISKS